MAGVNNHSHTHLAHAFVGSHHSAELWYAEWRKDRAGPGAGARPHPQSQGKFHFMGHTHALHRQFMPFIMTLASVMVLSETIRACFQSAIVDCHLMWSSSQVTLLTVGAAAPLNLSGPGGLNDILLPGLLVVLPSAIACKLLFC